MSGTRVAVGLVAVWCVSSVGPPPAQLPHSSPLESSRASFQALATDLADYRWPTEASRIVTSTFGEYRSSHFHAGIDISAGDVTGYRVFASRAGEVVRIRIGATGYGKLLVVRHADGYTTSYAHLQKFAGAIEERARREQLRLERYQIDVTPASGEFPVKKGEVVAYTGETGTGSPHLHFEIRDPAGNPVNPFLAPGIRTFDNIPPTIRRVAIAPADPRSLVDGTSADAILPVSGRDKNELVAGRSVVVVGGATVSVDVRDRIPGSRFRNGIYRDVLTVDGDTVYAMALDRLPAGPVHEIGLQFDWDLIDDGRGRFQRLSMTSPNDLPTYTPTTIPAGIIDAGRFGFGRHRYAVFSSDFAGNTASASGELTLSHEPEFTAECDSTALLVRIPSSATIRRLLVQTKFRSAPWQHTTYPAPAGGMPPFVRIVLPSSGADAVMVRAENTDGVVSAPAVMTIPRWTGLHTSLAVSAEVAGEAIRVTLTSDGILSSSPLAYASEGGHQIQLRFRNVDEHSAVGIYSPDIRESGSRRIVAQAIVDGAPRQAEMEFEVFPMAPGTSGRLLLDAGSLVIDYDSLSVLAPLLLRWSRMEDDGERVYTLGPGFPVLGNGFRVTLRDPTPGPHRALFFRGRGDWTLIGGRHGSPANTGRLSSTLGELAMLADSVAPTVSRFSVEGTRSRLPRLRFRYRDDRSGIEYDSLKTYLDGSVVIAEVDGEHRRATVIPSAPLARGTHRLTIRIADKMGNQSIVERSFTLR
jgi:hypothetical protein